MLPIFISILSCRCWQGGTPGAICCGFFPYFVWPVLTGWHPWCYAFAAVFPYLSGRSWQVGTPGAICCSFFPILSVRCWQAGTPGAICCCFFPYFVWPVLTSSLEWGEECRLAPAIWVTRPQKIRHNSPSRYVTHSNPKTNTVVEVTNDLGASVGVFKGEYPCKSCNKTEGVEKWILLKRYQFLKSFLSKSYNVRRSYKTSTIGFRVKSLYEFLFI